MGPVSVRQQPAARTSNARLSAVDFDLVHVARKILEGSLSVVLGEKVLVVADEEHAPLARAVHDAATELGVNVHVMDLDALGGRPWPHLPRELGHALTSAQASLYLCSTDGAHKDDGDEGGLTELFTLVKKLNLRHGHVTGVSRRALVASYAADPVRVLDTTRAVRVRLRPDSKLSLRTPAGSQLEVTLDPAHRWIEHVGVIRAGRREPLPQGALRTAPRSVNGVFVADASTSAHAEARGDRTPITLELEGGICKGVRSNDLTLKRRTEEMLRRDAHADRVGTILLGTNVGLTSPLGEVGCDLTLPGLHVSFGDAFSEQTGATSTSRGRFTATCSLSDVDLDGAPLLRAGRYMIT